VRDPYRAIEVAALEVVSEAHDASIPSALARPGPGDNTARTWDAATGAVYGTARSNHAACAMAA
jgi:hypothetical protein